MPSCQGRFLREPELHKYQLSGQLLDGGQNIRPRAPPERPLSTLHYPFALLPPQKGRDAQEAGWLSYLLDAAIPCPGYPDSSLFLQPNEKLFAHEQAHVIQRNLARALSSPVGVSTWRGAKRARTTA